MSMSTSTEVIAHHWAFAIFSYRCHWPVLPDAGRRVGFFRRSRTREVEKHVPFESGIDSVGSARLRLSAKFYLVAMFFVIFDVEALYLFAWSTPYPRKRLGRLCGSCNFYFCVTGRSGLSGAYWRAGLDAARSRRERMNPETNSIANRQR